MAWSFKRNAGNSRREQSLSDRHNAPPQANPYAFVNPNYRRGGPWSEQPLPTYADTIGSHPNSDHPYDTITAQQKVLPYGTYPPAGSPPDKWNGYKLDNFTRSIDQEHVLNADEGRHFGSEIPAQQRKRPALNPYWYRNVPDRPQRAPDGYQFLRKFDQGVLGRRNLTGNHFSQAQTVTDNNRLALQGMIAPLRRRSTYRLEPIAYGEDTVTVADATGFVPAPGVVDSPITPSFGPRSFRLG
jgi:hypothetical protein